MRNCSSRHPVEVYENCHRSCANVSPGASLVLNCICIAGGVVSTPDMRILITLGFAGFLKSFTTMQCSISTAAMC